MSKINIPLTTKYIGRTFRQFNELDSTNNYLSNEYEGPFTEGFVVSTDYQTNGMGRKQRKWFASKNNSLLFSILLRPQQNIQELHELTQIMALSISIAIEKITTLNTSIKWPNDIYIGNKKCGGILSELLLEKELFYNPVVIIGAGININETKNGFPTNIKNTASSLLIETGIKWDKYNILAAILSSFEHYYEIWKNDGFYNIIDEIALRFYLKNKKVKVIVSNNTIIYGNVLGMDSKGYLMLKENRGTVHCIMAGDVIICS